MPTLRYTPTAFGRYMGRAFSQPTEITFSWAELCRAAITVGRRRWADVLQFGTYSVLEAMWRLAMIRANIVEEPNSRLRKSRAFENLDPSEKGAVSYFIGLAVAKLISERLFGVPWLLHLDVYRQYLSPQIALRDKPDFVGLNSAAHWVVIETKGRTNSAGSDLLDKAKRQTRSLREIDGQMPVLRAAIVVDFAYDRLRVRVKDPDEFEANAPDLAAEARELLRAYYQPMVQLIQHLPRETRQDPATGRSYVRAAVPLLDATVELNELILPWYESSESSMDELERVLPQFVEVLQRRREYREMNEDEKHLTETTSHDEIIDLDSFRRAHPIGADGVVVTLGGSWSTEMMRREPEDRS